jgi:hypothetical protein
MARGGHGSLGEASRARHDHSGIIAPHVPAGVIDPGRQACSRVRDAYGCRKCSSVSSVSRTLSDRPSDTEQRRQAQRKLGIPIANVHNVTSLVVDLVGRWRLSTPRPFEAESHSPEGHFTLQAI